MSGKKGRSGRKRGASSLVAAGLDLVDQKLPEIFDALIKRAVGYDIDCPQCGAVIEAVRGDRESQIYLIDRRLGKPKATAEIEGDSDSKLTALAVTQLLNIFEERRREVEQTSVITEDAPPLIETSVITEDVIPG